MNAERIQLPRSPGAVAMARRHVALRFAERLSAPALGNATLVVSELVTNAYLHGEGHITLQMSVAGGRLRIEVIDDGTGQVPTIREPREDRPGGWGLQLVGAVSHSWGAFEGTTHVWAELALS